MAAAVEQRDGKITRLQGAPAGAVRPLGTPRPLPPRARAGRFRRRYWPPEASGSVVVAGAGSQPRRKPLPDHLPRDGVTTDITAETCPAGGAMHSIGEERRRMLDWVSRRSSGAAHPVQNTAAEPATGSFKRRHRNDRSTAVWRRRADRAGLVSKHCDRTPLYRQSRIFARHGVGSGALDAGGLDRQRLLVAEGAARSLVQARLPSDHLFADDTPVPVLDRVRGAGPAVADRRTVAGYVIFGGRGPGASRAAMMPTVAKRRNIASIRSGDSFAPPSSHHVSIAM